VTCHLYEGANTPADAGEWSPADDEA
jgi:hypothetical protein